MERNINDETKDLMKIIQIKFPKLSKGQKLIAEYILKNYDKAAFMTAAKLGVSVGVSESTVVRFAIELGFSGYPKLQKSLQELIKNKLTTVQRQKKWGISMSVQRTITTSLSFVTRNLGHSRSRTPASAVPRAGDSG